MKQQFKTKSFLGKLDKTGLYHMEDVKMTTINLRDFFYWYITDELIEVSDEVAAVLRSDRRYEERWNAAQAQGTGAGGSGR